MQTPRSQDLGADQPVRQCALRQQPLRDCAYTRRGGQQRLRRAGNLCCSGRRVLAGSDHDQRGIPDAQRHAHQVLTGEHAEPASTSVPSKVIQLWKSETMHQVLRARVALFCTVHVQFMEGRMRRTSGRLRWHLLDAGMFRYSYRHSLPSGPCVSWSVPHKPSPPKVYSSRCCFRRNAEGEIAWVDVRRHWCPGMSGWECTAEHCAPMTDICDRVTRSLQDDDRHVHLHAAQHGVRL